MAREGFGINPTNSRDIGFGTGMLTGYGSAYGVQYAVAGEFGATTASGIGLSGFGAGAAFHTHAVTNYDIPAQMERLALSDYNQDLTVSLNDAIDNTRAAGHARLADRMREGQLRSLKEEAEVAKEIEDRYAPWKLGTPYLVDGAMEAPSYYGGLIGDAWRWCTGGDKYPKRNFEK